MFNISLIN